MQWCSIADLVFVLKYQRRRFAAIQSQQNQNSIKRKANKLVEMSSLATVQKDRTLPLFLRIEHIWSTKEIDFFPKPTESCFAWLTVGKY